MNSRQVFHTVRAGMAAKTGIVRKWMGLTALVAMMAAVISAPASAATIHDPSLVSVLPTYVDPPGAQIGSFDYIKTGADGVAKDEASVLAAIALVKPSWGTDFEFVTSTSPKNPHGNSVITAVGVLFTFFSGANFHAFLFAEPLLSLEILNKVGINNAMVFVAKTAAVPLPAGLALLAPVLAGLGFLGWRRKHSAKISAAAA